MRRHLQQRSSGASRRQSRVSEAGTLARCLSTDKDRSSARSSELRECHDPQRKTEHAAAADRMRTERRLFPAGGPLGPTCRPPRKQARQGLLGWLERRNISLWGTLLLSVSVLMLGPLAPEGVETSSSPVLVNLDNTDLSAFTQEQLQSGELMEQGAPLRRLSNIVEWAAEIERVLRLSPRLSLYIGIFLTLAGSLLMAGGSTLMKLGLSIEDEVALRTQWCDQQWLWGFAAYVAGACMHVIALGFAPASVLSPMNSIGLIANAVASATVLKEPFGFQELLFTGGCAFGVFLCACASVLPRTEFVDMGGEIDARYIGLYSWRDPWYLAFLGACCGLGFGALVYLNSVESALLEEREQQLLREADRGVGLLTLSSSHANGGGSVSKNSPRGEPNSPRGGGKQFVYPRLVGLCYGFLAGIVGSQCILEVKEIGTCVRVRVSPSAVSFFHPLCSLAASSIRATKNTIDHTLKFGGDEDKEGSLDPQLALFDCFACMAIGAYKTISLLLVVPSPFHAGFAKFHEVQGFSAGALVLFGLGFGLTAMCIILLAVEEMQNLRRYVDQQVPEYSDEEADLAAQDLVEQRLSKHVTFAMGMFPISSLGRTAGRRRFRPIYQRFRRTRSTASDTALGDAYGELTVGSSSVAGAYTLPPNIHFPRRSIDSYVMQAHGDTHHSPSHAISLQPSSPSRSLEAISRASLGATHPPPASDEAQGKPDSMVSRIPTHHLIPPSLRSSYQSQYLNAP
ncbi:hypothetical protein ACSSS7_000321 [Eimeria intestinalis]